MHRLVAPSNYATFEVFLNIIFFIFIAETHAAYGGSDVIIIGEGSWCSGRGQADSVFLTWMLGAHTQSKFVDGVSKRSDFRYKGVDHTITIACCCCWHTPWTFISLCNPVLNNDNKLPQYFDLKPNLWSPRCATSKRILSFDFIYPFLSNVPCYSCL